MKSIKLMQYLTDLVTPPRGSVLDPFMGTGTTGIAALRNGYKFTGIEKEEEYFLMAQKRITAATAYLL